VNWLLVVGYAITMLSSATAESGNDPHVKKQITTDTMNLRIVLPPLSVQGSKFKVQRG
jgi:hypothetical protein